MNCNTPTDVTFSFTGFAQRGGRTDHHADGWGIAFFEGRGLRHFVDHQPACESPVAELIRRYPIKSRNVIAHIRKATQGAVGAGELPPVRARAVGPLLGVRAQRRPEGLPPAPARQLPSGGQHRQRARLLLDHAGAGQVARRRAQRGRADADPARAGAAASRGTAPSTSCCPTAQALWAHCSTNLWYVERRHPFAHAHLADEDLSDRLRPAHHAAGPRGRGGDGAADHQRALDAVPAGRIAGVRGRRRALLSRTAKVFKAYGAPSVVEFRGGDAPAALRARSPLPRCAPAMPATPAAAPARPAARWR